MACPRIGDRALPNPIITQYTKHCVNLSNIQQVSLSSDMFNLFFGFTISILLKQFVIMHIHEQSHLTLYLHHSWDIVQSSSYYFILNIQDDPNLLLLGRGLYLVVIPVLCLYPLRGNSIIRPTVWIRYNIVRAFVFPKYLKCPDCLHLNRYITTTLYNIRTRKIVGHVNHIFFTDITNCPYRLTGYLTSPIYLSTKQVDLP